MEYRRVYRLCLSSLHLLFLNQQHCPFLIGSRDLEFNIEATLNLVTIDCLMGILIIYGQMGMVYHDSNIWIEKMQRQQNSLRIAGIHRKWEERFYRSCSPLKIMISPGNFVDQLTPLICLQFAMKTTVNLLLLTQK